MPLNETFAVGLHLPLTLIGTDEQKYQRESALADAYTNGVTVKRNKAGSVKVITVSIVPRNGGRPATVETDIGITKNSKMGDVAKIFKGAGVITNEDKALRFWYKDADGQWLIFAFEGDTLKSISIAVPETLTGV